MRFEEFYRIGGGNWDCKHKSIFVSVSKRISVNAYEAPTISRKILKKMKSIQSFVETKMNLAELQYEHLIMMFRCFVNQNGMNFIQVKNLGPQPPP